MMFTYKKYVYLLLCILLINISCTKTKKEYYPNGKIYTITYYKKQDSLSFRRIFRIRKENKAFIL